MGGDLEDEEVEEGKEEEEAREVDDEAAEAAGALLAEAGDAVETFAQVSWADLCVGRSFVVVLAVYIAQCGRSPKV